MLVSLYIENHSYLFKGEPQIINLGGKYLYDYQKTGETINITREESEKYIEGFFNISDASVKISLATAIVGENGVGKSSILRGIFNIIRGKENDMVFDFFDSSEFGYILLFEKGDSILYHSNTTYNITSDPGIDLQKAQTYKNNYKTTYYSPHFDIVNVDSPHEDIISLVRTYFNDSFSSVTDSISDRNYSALKLTHNNWVRYIQFLRSDIFKKKIFRDILPDISTHFGRLEFNFKTEYYLQHVPVEHQGLISGLLNRINSLIDETKENNESFINTDFLNNEKKRIKLKFLKALLSNMVYHLGIPKNPVEKDIPSVSSYDDLNESELLEYFINNFHIKEVKIYSEKKFIEFKDLVFNVIDSHYDLKSLLNKPLNDSLIADELRVPYEEIEKIQESQLVIFKELNNLYQETGYEKPNTIAKFLVLYKLNRNMSSGEIAFLNIFSILLDYTSNTLSERKSFDLHSNYILLIDEGDLGFHPQWKKKYINLLLQSVPYFFEKINKDLKLQLLITTHDPFTLSDFPNSNVVFIKKDGILDQHNKERIQNTFGANISELLSNSFFISDGLIGDFVKSKITKVIRWINENKDQKNKENIEFKELLEENKKVISLIDERVVRLKLTEMISELEGNNGFQIQQLEEELKRLKGLK